MPKVSTTATSCEQPQRFAMDPRQRGRLRAAETSIEAFERFAVLERDLEPIETAVEDLVIEIDNYIDMQVDIMRGK
jgi:hypothetical protein